MIDLRELLNTLKYNAVGRFDGRFTPGIIPLWFNLNNEGGTPRPRVRELSATQVIIDGGFAFEHKLTGKGSGSLSFAATLTGEETCRIAFTLASTFRSDTIETTGTYDAGSTDDGRPFIRYTLDTDDGMIIEQSVFPSSTVWYQGVVLQFISGDTTHEFAFENMSGIQEDPQKNTDPRNTPGGD